MKNTNDLIVNGSTRKFFREGKKTEDYSFYDFLHGYTYIKWPYLYISVALGEHKLTKILQHLRACPRNLCESRRGPLRIFNRPAAC